MLEVARRKQQVENLEKGTGDYLKLRVGGMEIRGDNLSEQVDWVNQHVKIGDEITIRIVDVPQWDEPKSREAMDE